MDVTYMKDKKMNNKKFIKIWKIYLLQHARYQNNVKYGEGFLLPTFLSAQGNLTQRLTKAWLSTTKAWLSRNLIPRVKPSGSKW